MFIDQIVDDTVNDTYFIHKMSIIYIILLVTTAVAVSYIEASSEEMSVACVDDTCVAMTVITDCADKVEDEEANATPYENADDGADEGEDGVGDGSGGDGEDGSGGADGDTTRAVSVVLASTPLSPRRTHLEALEAGNKSRYNIMHTNVTASTMTTMLLVPISVKASSKRKNKIISTINYCMLASQMKIRIIR